MILQRTDKTLGREDGEISGGRQGERTGDVKQVRSTEMLSLTHYAVGVNSRISTR